MSQIQHITYVSASEEEDNETPLETPLAGENVEQDSSPPTRKRTRKEHVWKRNVRKSKKLCGYSYTSTTGKIMPGKTFVCSNSMCMF